MKSNVETVQFSIGYDQDFIQYLCLEENVMPFSLYDQLCGGRDKDGVVKKG